MLVPISQYYMLSWKSVPLWHPPIYICVCKGVRICKNQAVWVDFMFFRVG